MHYKSQYILLWVFVIAIIVEDWFIILYAPQPSSAQDDLERHIKEILPLFSEKFELSNREQEVLNLVIANKSNKEIAGQLYLSEGTVKTHVHNIMKKTHTSSRRALKLEF